MTEPLRIAVCVKQVPAFVEMGLGADGRLVRAGRDLELNPYCRRAVAQGAMLAAATGGYVTVFTMGPPSAEDALREALAWCDAQGASAKGVLVSDPAFAGSDTLATARTLRAAIDREGPFDLVLLGRNAVDADTGQVGPEVAELLGWPFLAAVRTLTLDGASVEAHCETDDGWTDATTTLPAVLTCAERLCDPAKVDPAGRAAVDGARIVTRAAPELGPGPWGVSGSPTWVGATRSHVVARRGVVDANAPLEDQIATALAVLQDLGAFADDTDSASSNASVPTTGGAGSVAVLVEADRPDTTRELLGAGAQLAAVLDASVTAIVTEPADPATYGSWGADVVVEADGSRVEEDLAHAVSTWIADVEPTVVLAPSTAWGREVAARIAARLGLGLTGDAIDLSVEDGRLVAWKPAFGGELVAAIHSRSTVQMATVRPGVLAVGRPRAHRAEKRALAVPARSHVTVLGRGRDDDVHTLAAAPVVVGVGQGVDPAHYEALTPLLEVLGAELAATRKVTDQGWMPRARQLGITGRSISPRLYVAVGVGGKFNHTSGVRGARAVLAINPDPDALIFDAADAGIVADWETAVPTLVAALEPLFLRG